MSTAADARLQRKGRRVDGRLSSLIGDFEGVDRLEGLRDDVETVDAGGSHELVLVHLAHERRGRPAHHAEQLLTQEEGDRDARLRGADCADAVLNRLRRRVRAALNLERRVGLLQSRRGATELPARLSRRAKLHTESVVHFLDGGHVVMSDDVERAQVNFARFVVHLLQEGRTNEHGSEPKQHLLVGSEPAARRAHAAALDIGTLQRGSCTSARAW